MSADKLNNSNDHVTPLRSLESTHVFSDSFRWHRDSVVLTSVIQFSFLPAASGRHCITIINQRGSFVAI